MLENISLHHIGSLALLLFGLILILLSLRKKDDEIKHDFLNNKTQENIDKEMGKTMSLWESFSKVLNNSISSDPAEIRKKLVSSGFYSPKFAKYYVPAKYAFIITGIVWVLVMYFEFNWSYQTSLIFGLIWLVAGVVIPDMYLSLRAKSLRRDISNRLPYILDLMGVCVQTGMTIETAIRYLAKEIEAFDKDMAYLFKRLNDRSNLMGINTALEELYEQVPTNEVRSFVVTLTQSLQYGSSIYTALTTLSSDIREVQILTVEEKIGKLAAKMSIPLILFILMPIVILIAAPGIMRMVFNA